jgi:peptide/nickel transport system ATP-binding protein
MSLLEIERLTVSFRRRDGLMRRVSVDCVSDISLSVARGEVLALFGASGAGKSLLAHAVMGLLPENAPVGGLMRFDGRVLDRPAQTALRGNRIALVPQSVGHLDPLARVGQQLRWAARRARQPMTAAEGALSRFDLAPAVARAFPHMLSGGMARRVMLAMTIASGADLVIADEPSNGLDAENTSRVFRCLKSFAEAGKAVIVISHDLPAALKVADRVVILRDGRVAAEERADAFAGGGEALSAAYARAIWSALPQNGFARAYHEA